jgi:hypothetical protein
MYVRMYVCIYVRYFSWWTFAASQPALYRRCNYRVTFVAKRSHLKNVLVSPDFVLFPLYCHDHTTTSLPHRPLPHHPYNDHTFSPIDPKKEKDTNTATSNPINHQPCYLVLFHQHPKEQARVTVTNRR